MAIDNGANEVNMFRSLVASDEAVKAVFDHFRNIGIAGAVIATGIWNLTHPATGVLRYFSFVSSAAIGILGLFLFAVAERHGHRKFKEANIPWYWELVALFIYAQSVFSLAMFATMRLELH